jgi:FecR protein
LIAQFRLPLLALVILLLFIAIPQCNAAIGTVTEQTGPTEIIRNKASIPSELKSGVEMDDTISTANAKAGITFVDNTQVQITEQSKLVIDNFVYDPNKNAGKLAIKIALGTVRYASGQIAKNDPEQVKIETPTATIGVRGTDFSSTVDEIGRSTIILLPSCPEGWKDIEKDCITGKIIVKTDAGELMMTKPFQATTIDSRMHAPAKPTILSLDMSQINNLLIVSPPPQLKKAENTTTATKSFNFLDFDFLGQDLLKYDELSVDYLQQSTSKLDINYLDNDYLNNLLDVATSQLLGNELDQYNSLLPKYNSASGIKYTVDADNLTLYRETINGYAEVNTSVVSSMTVNFDQDNSTPVSQIVNHSGSTTITIKQSL